MEVGVFHEFPSLGGRPDADAFQEAFAIVDAAERWGLDVMWLAELHFDPSRSVLSAPLCVASAIAGRTERIGIGIGGAGAAAGQSASHRRGSGDRRSDQPRPADFRRRPQWGGEDLRGLQRAVRAKPGPVRRNAGYHRAGLG